MSSIVFGVVLIIAVIGIGCVIAVMYSNAQSMGSEVSRIQQRLKALEEKEQGPPRLCSTHGHSMEAVYDENKGSDLSESKISALSEAARRNGESIETLIEMATKEEKVFVKTVCKYCGLTVGRDSTPKQESCEEEA